MHRRHFIAATTSFLAVTGFTATAQDQPDERAMSGPDPMAAAEYLSMLEKTKYVSALYTLYSFMHADAQATVPMATVIGWYRADFQPRGPEPAIASGVTGLRSRSEYMFAKRP